jgi:hypothetical protein
MIEEALAVFRAAVTQYWTAVDAVHGADSEWDGCVHCDNAAWNLVWAALDLDNALDHGGRP